MLNEQRESYKHLQSQISSSVYVAFLAVSDWPHISVLLNICNTWHTTLDTHTNVCVYIYIKPQINLSKSIIIKSCTALTELEFTRKAICGYSQDRLKAKKSLGTEQSLNHLFTTTQYTNTLSSSSIFIISFWLYPEHKPPWIKVSVVWREFLQSFDGTVNNLHGSLGWQEVFVPIGILVVVHFLGEVFPKHVHSDAKLLWDHIVEPQGCRHQKDKLEMKSNMSRNKICFIFDSLSC